MAYMNDPPAEAHAALAHTLVAAVGPKPPTAALEDALRG